VDCNFNCLFKTEELIKVTRSHLHSKCGSMSKMVQDGVVVTTDH